MSINAPIKIILTIYISLFFSQSCYSQDTQHLKLAATPWCPYTCDYNEFPGYATQYIETLLKKKNITISVDFMKWEEAIAKTHRGEYQGMVTVSPGETTDILFTQTPTDSYQSCFYTLKESIWEYTGLDSLNNINLGVINHYVYGQPLDNWLTHPENNQSIYSSTESNKLDNLINQLKQRNIDAFTSDRNVISHYLYRQNRQNIEIKEVGCLEESPFYFGLKPETDNAKEIIDYLNNSLVSPKNIQLKHYFKLRYGLEKYF